MDGCYSLFILVRNTDTLALNCKTGCFAEVGLSEARKELLESMERDGLELPMLFKVDMTEDGEMVDVSGLPMQLLSATVPPEVPTAFD